MEVSTVTKSYPGKDSKSLYIFNLLNEGVNLNEAWHFVTDGAWDAESMRGAAARVKRRGSRHGGSSARVREFQASSAASVEVRAGILALQWANNEEVMKVCLYTDSM
ncbi:hypothetical protein RHMOL_Rhmol03G0032600 [Rhododendron molle]|uniref:Uncharacterized protein n=1 Tax=Rhododendron molle TaxID=49168 RepID=A0ACC0PA01_RHOML|nr:hypothetical protein RHMOL_Rhmol03G0032600 [Rhododendron molle]